MVSVSKCFFFKNGDFNGAKTDLLKGHFEAVKVDSFLVPIDGIAGFYGVNKSPFNFHTPTYFVILQLRNTGTSQHFQIFGTNNNFPDGKSDFEIEIKIFKQLPKLGFRKRTPYSHLRKYQ